MVTWPKRTVDWIEGGVAYLSVPFTWDLPAAYSQCVWYKTQGYRVRAGGPAVSLMPDYLCGVAGVGGAVDALPRHNPSAVFTSRGCVRSCDFCAVPRIEGDLVEIKDWEPRPVVCDNNLLACSRAHFDRVIDKLKPVKGVDFNQGLDARLLKARHIDRLRELDLSKVRLAWDDVKMEPVVMQAIKALLKVLPPRKVGVYVLVNFRDTPDDAQYRCETLKAMGVFPNVQRFQPLHATVKDSYLAPGWDEKWLRRFVRYWSRQVRLEHIPFESYTLRKIEKATSLPLKEVL